MVMVGGETEKRIRGAVHVVKQKAAKALVIPGYSHVVPAKNIDMGTYRIEPQAQMLEPKVSIEDKSFQFIESTHVELLRGKMIMDRLGYRSAMIVSSPYHMLRLRLIAGHVFDRKNYSIGLSSTSFESYKRFIWLRSWESFRLAVAEYTKMTWFLVYCWFV